jgi:hypothetical protein
MIHQVDEDIVGKGGERNDPLRSALQPDRPARVIGYFERI